MPATAKDQLVFRERLWVPWWWYVITAICAALLAGTFHLALYEITAWLPFAIIIPLGLLVCFRIGRGLVEIDATELRVRGAHLPLDAIGAIAELDARTVRLIAGRQGDPASYVVLQPWIGPGVQIIIEDPDDPTPYWLFSTRHPHRVAELLRAHRGG